MFQKNIVKDQNGIGIPLGDWLRDELKEWGEDLLNKKS